MESSEAIKISTIGIFVGHSRVRSMQKSAETSEIARSRITAARRVCS